LGTHEPAFAELLQAMRGPTGHTPGGEGRRAISNRVTAEQWRWRGSGMVE
jgi:hypothetical protein